MMILTRTRERVFSRDYDGPVQIMLFFSLLFFYDDHFLVSSLTKLAQFAKDAYLLAFFFLSVSRSKPCTGPEPLSPSSLDLQSRRLDRPERQGKDLRARHVCSLAL